MGELVKSIFAAPVASLLIIAGICFLVIAVVGDISGKIEPGKAGRIAAGLIGTTLVVIGLSMSDKQPASMAGLEEHTNRWGGDYRGFDIADAESCRQECSKEGICVAFTFVKPGFQGSSGRCWLKNVVPSPTSNDCCTSGVKQ